MALRFFGLRIIIVLLLPIPALVAPFAPAFLPPRALLRLVPPRLVPVKFRLLPYPSVKIRFGLAEGGVIKHARLLRNVKAGVAGQRLVRPFRRTNSS